MSTVDEQVTISQATRSLQIIVVALTTGLVFFLGIAAFLRYQTNFGPPAAPPPGTVVHSARVCRGRPGLGGGLAGSPFLTTNARRQIARGKPALPTTGGIGQVESPAQQRAPPLI